MTRNSKDMTSAPAKRRSREEQDPNLPRGPERFFYDKNTYTGAHKKGGPTHYDDDG